MSVYIKLFSLFVSVFSIGSSASAKIYKGVLAYTDRLGDKQTLLRGSLNAETGIFVATHDEKTSLDLSVFNDYSFFIDENEVLEAGVNEEGQSGGEGSGSSGGGRG